ncbi:MAG TPA: phosphatidylglycerophosphatase A [Candidatus Limnocylindrales bacterium]|nr:phosphatidylglycerophosphatase A [Candidatus Limnocylindrales bacterium]
MRRLAVLLATGFGLGYLPIAPATWASAATTLVLFAVLPGAGLPAFVVSILAVTALALLVCGPAEKTLGHDAHPIVMDEVAGMMVTVCGVPAIGHAHPPYAITLALGFLLFRIFDVWKPFPVGRAQALPGAYGIVADDILAGIYSNLVLQILARVMPSA